MSEEIEKIQCALCFKTDVWVQVPADPEYEDSGWIGGAYTKPPEGWCRGYNSDGGNIYFCSKQHHSLWERAIYLSWQALDLLHEFAKTMRPK